MNVLPRVNFCSYMLPMAPPPGYWQKYMVLLKGFYGEADDQK